MFELRAVLTREALPERRLCLLLVSYFLPFLSLIAGAGAAHPAPRYSQHWRCFLFVFFLTFIPFFLWVIMAFWKTTSSHFQHCAVPHSLIRKGNAVHNDHVDEAEDWTKSVLKMTNQIQN